MRSHRFAQLHAALLLATGCGTILGIHDTHRGEHAVSSGGAGGNGTAGQGDLAAAACQDHGECAGANNFAGTGGAAGRGGVDDNSAGNGGAAGQGGIDEQPSAGSSGADGPPLDHAPFLAGPRWAGGVVPVCWDRASAKRSDFLVRSRQVRDLANGSWPTVANVEFSDWDQCGLGAPGRVRVILSDSSKVELSAFGYSSAGSVLTLGVLRADFEKGLIPREFGHIIGLSYDPATPDPIEGSATGCDATSNDSTPSVDSVLAPPGPCALESELSLWDAAQATRAYGARTQLASPLLVGTNSATGDHAAITMVEADSFFDAGYAWTSAEGWLFNFQIPGTVPLNRYWSDSQQESLSTPATEGQGIEHQDGYSLVRRQGYLFSSEQPGTVPLKLFVNVASGDTLVSASAGSEQAALAAGYVYMQTEGYIPASLPYLLGWTYENPDPYKGERILTAQNSPLTVKASDAGYAFTGFDSAFMKFPFQDTVPMKTYFGVSRGDYFTLANPTSESTATGFGYLFTELEGYVYAGAVDGAIPGTSYFSVTRLDNLTTFEYTPPPNGYSLNRVEGYAFPLNGPGK